MSSTLRRCTRAPPQTCSSRRAVASSIHFAALRAEAEEAEEAEEADEAVVAGGVLSVWWRWVRSRAAILQHQRCEPYQPRASSWVTRPPDFPSPNAAAHPITLDTFFKKFDQFADAPNAVAKMRELVLQLAVQGKLVSQNPKDQPAEKLLAAIKSERQQTAIENGSNRHRTSAGQGRAGSAGTLSGESKVELRLKKPQCATPNEIRSFPSIVKITSASGILRNLALVPL